MALSKIKKFEEITFSQWVAIGNKLGGLKNVIGILDGNLTVVVKKASKSFFDKSGRRIPERLRERTCDPNKDFKFFQPRMVEKMEFAYRISHLHEALEIDTGITAEQLLYATYDMRTVLSADPQTFNLTNAVYFPIVIPQTKIFDVGTIIDRWLEGVAKSYTKNFSHRNFDGMSGKFEKTISINCESRHNYLIERIEQGPIIGLYFPNALQGFSVQASREQMITLPENFILSGLDAIIGMIMYPDFLARDWHTPVINLSAFDLSVYSLYFNVSNKSLAVGIIEGIHGVNNAESGGLFFYR